MTSSREPAGCACLIDRTQFTSDMLNRFLISAGLGMVLSPAVIAASLPLPPSRGERMIAEYFRLETARLADRCLADIKTLDDWTSRRAEYRQQLFEMLGLWPVPPKTDLKPVITGKIEPESFTVEKLHFQSLPGLYVTANLYVPKI